MAGRVTLALGGPVTLPGRACDGGPHLLLPSESATSWSGILPPRDGRIVTANFRLSTASTEPASDYDAACDVDGLIGLVPVGDNLALVLGDEVPMSTWLPSSQFKGGLLVVLMQWAGPIVPDSRLLELVQSVDASLFVDAGVAVRSQSGSFVLCAAADFGPKWCYPTVKIAVASGEYRVLSAEVEAQGYWLRLHGLQHVARSLRDLVCPDSVCSQTHLSAAIFVRLCFGSNPAPTVPVLDRRAKGLIG